MIRKLLITSVNYVTTEFKENGRGALFAINKISDKNPISEILR